MSLRIDHVVLACRDLDAAAERLRATYGLRSVPGGEHAAWGTANRLVPAGREYVELLGVGDAEKAALSPMGQAVLALSADGDRLARLALAADDIEAVAARLGTDVLPGERALPDGSVLRWRLTGVAESMQEGVPFFIDWGGVVAVDPDAAGPGGPTAVDQVTLRGDVRRLEDWIGDAVPGVRLVEGPPGIAEVVLRTATGELRLPERP